MQVAVGEDVARDERVRVRLHGLDPGDAVVEEQASLAQQPVHGAGVALELAAPDVLVHADAHDLLERTVADLAVVGDTDLH